MKSSAALPFYPKEQQLWIIRTEIFRKGHIPGAFSALSVVIICFFRLCAVQLRKMRLQSSVFPLHPQLFQIETKRKQIQFCPHIHLAAYQESSETEIRLKQLKCALHLNGAA